MKRIPTILALLFLILLIGGIMGVMEYMTQSKLTKQPDNPPKNVQFTNVSDSFFTLTWVTHEKATGEIIVSGTNMKRLRVRDDRDMESKKNSLRYTHHATARNLTPFTPYTIDILSNGKKFQNTGVSYQVQTAGPLSFSTNNLEPAYGTVLTQTSLPADDAIVLLTAEGSQLVSTFVKPTGSWLLPLNLLRTLDLQKSIEGKLPFVLSVTVLSKDDTATALTTTKNDSPVPPITLGKTYDFQNKLSQNSKSNTSVLGAQSQHKPGTPYEVSLVSPKQGASLPTNLPLIQGTGVPGKSVLVTVGITKPVSQSIKIGGDGLWRFTPPKPLGIGKQSVTITSPNENGKPVAITHTFDILKSGTQVLGVATPSGELTPTDEPTPTLEPTQTATPTGDLTPTEEPTPTEEIAGKPIPVSGSVTSTIVLLSLGFIFLITGGFILVK